MDRRLTFQREFYGPYLPINLLSGDHHTLEFELIDKNIYIDMVKPILRQPRGQCPCYNHHYCQTDSLCDHADAKEECAPECGLRCGNQRIRSRDFEPLSNFKMRTYRGRGYGVYTEREIPKESILFEYTGEIITADRYRDRQRRFQGSMFGYIFGDYEDFVLDPRFKGSIARFCNHSCDPNCYAYFMKVDGRQRLVFKSLKLITKGEEITVNYFADDLRIGAKQLKFGCKCYSKNCVAKDNIKEEKSGQSTSKSTGETRSSKSCHQTRKTSGAKDDSKPVDSFPHQARKSASKRKGSPPPHRVSPPARSPPRRSSSPDVNKAARSQQARKKSVSPSDRTTRRSARGRKQSVSPPSHSPPRQVRQTPRSHAKDPDYEASQSDQSSNSDGFKAPPPKKSATQRRSVVPGTKTATRQRNLIAEAGERVEQTPSGLHVILPTVPPQPGQPVIKCKSPTCGRTYSTRISAEGHYRSYHDPADLQCRKCKLHYLTQQKLDDHMKLCKSGKLPRAPYSTLTKEVAKLNEKLLQKDQRQTESASSSKSKSAKESASSSKSKSTKKNKEPEVDPKLLVPIVKLEEIYIEEDNNDEEEED